MSGRKVLSLVWKVVVIGEKGGISIKKAFGFHAYSYIPWLSKHFI